MSDAKIECRTTKWFLVRAILMGVMFFGFGGYFFYDAVIGYPRQNEVFFTHDGFKQAGEAFERYRSSPGDWAEYVGSAVLWSGGEADGRVLVKDSKGNDCPMPEGVQVSPALPAALANHAAMAEKGWTGAWNAYSAERRFPSKPGEKAHDASSIREQWIAGGVCMALGAGCLFLLLRTMSRRMAIEGDEVRAAGCRFRIQDIRLIDLRQWKLKGLARFTVARGGRLVRIRVDGMAYGGFEKNRGEPAEKFMQAVLACYEGEVMDYEEASAPDRKVS